MENRLVRNREPLAHQSRTAVEQVTGGGYDDMLARLERLNTSQRRVIVAAVLDRIDVAPAKPSQEVGP